MADKFKRTGPGMSTYGTSAPTRLHKTRTEEPTGPTGLSGARLVVICGRTAGLEQVLLSTHEDA
jgi:hypothetical protein